MGPMYRENGPNLTEGGASTELSLMENEPTHGPPLVRADGRNQRPKGSRAHADGVERAEGFLRGFGNISNKPMGRYYTILRDWSVH